MKFTAPHIEYDLISPILIVLGVAVLGVLVEAAVPRSPPLLGPGGARGPSAWSAPWALRVYVLEKIHPGSRPPEARLPHGASPALAVDGPTLFSWVLILVLALLGVLLFAERQLEGGVTAFAGQAAALPGTEAERQASAEGLEHTEVFPLLMFAVSGMLMFPAANDLLTLFVALEVLSLPLYLLCGLARRRRLLSQEAAMKYFMLGAFSSGFFVYGIALTYGYAGSMEFDKIAQAVASSQRRPRAPARRHGHARRRAAVQGRRRAVPHLDPGRLPGRTHRRSPASWPRRRRSPRSARCCGCSTSPSAAPAGTGGR